eukprot:evm.model.NODE_44167_length_5633_cov_34.679211.1
MESREQVEGQIKKKTRTSDKIFEEESHDVYTTGVGNNCDTKEDDNDSREQTHKDDQDILSLAALQCLHLVIRAGKHHLANHLQTLLPPLLLHHLLLPAYTSTILLLLTALSHHVELSLLLPPLLHLHAFTHPSSLVRAASLRIVCIGLTVVINAASTIVGDRVLQERLLTLALGGVKEDEEEVKEAGIEALWLVYDLFYSVNKKTGAGEDEKRNERESSFAIFIREQGGEALEADVRSWLLVKKKLEENREEEDDEQQQEQQQQQQQQQQHHHERIQKNGNKKPKQQTKQEAPLSPPRAASFFDRAKLFNFRRQVSDRSLIPRPASSTKPRASETKTLPPSSSYIASASTSPPSPSLPPSSPLPPLRSRRQPAPSIPQRSPIQGKGLVRWDNNGDLMDEEQRKEKVNITHATPFLFPLPQQHSSRHRPIFSPPHHLLQGKGLVEWRDDEEEEEEKGRKDGQSTATANDVFSPTALSSQPTPSLFRSRLPRPSHTSFSPMLSQSLPMSRPSPPSALLIEYLPPADIHPLPQPSIALPLLLESLPIADWPESFQALTTVRRFARRHPALLLALPPDRLQLLLRQVLRHVNNLRSAVAKNALLAVADLWAGLASSSSVPSSSSSSSSNRLPLPSKSSGSEITVQRVIEGELPAVVAVLLKRFCDTSGFLVEAAESALDAVMLHTPDTTRVLLAFLPLASHKSPAGRSKVASQVLRCLLVLTSVAATSPPSAVTAAGGGVSPRKRKTQIRARTTMTTTNRKHNNTSGGGLLGEDLRERLELATKQWLKDANCETRAQGRKIAEVLPFLMQR